MAIGAVAGHVIPTNDLEVGAFVSVDREVFQVAGFEARKASVAVVLDPQFGKSWHLEVAESDLEEPMWEIV